MLQTLATSMRVQRLLMLASVVTLAWLALAQMASPAFAHAGHKHGTSQPTALQTQAPSQVHGIDQQPAAPMPMHSAVLDHADLAAGFDNDAARGHVVAATTGWQATGVRCVCAAGCGTCSSMSCCAAGILPDATDMFAPTPASALTPTRTSALTSGQIAPLPRPPNSLLRA